MIGPGASSIRDLWAVWEHRQLLYFLIWKDVKIRYKQTFMGVAWVVVQPAATVLVFSVVFGVLLRVPSDDVPYPLFACAALIPWTYFSAALARSSNSLVANAPLVTKTYFPRLILPLAATLAPIVDFLVSLAVLAGLMVYYGMSPAPEGLFLLPLMFALAFLATSGVALWFSALNVRYRDVAQALPFVLQVWMYMTPVVFSITVVPEAYRSLVALNPMATVVEGFRLGLLGRETPTFLQMAVISTGVALALLVTGLLYFRRTERTFADVI